MIGSEFVGGGGWVLENLVDYDNNDVCVCIIVSVLLFTFACVGV